MNRENKTTHGYRTSIKKLITAINVLHSRPHDANVKNFLDLVDHHFNNYGAEHAVKLLKSYRLYLQRVVLNQPVEPLPFCQVDRKGFPKVLKPWRISLGSPVDDIRYVMSFWRILEVFRTSPKYEVSTIINKPDVNRELMDDIKKFMST